MEQRAQLGNRPRGTSFVHSFIHPTTIYCMSMMCQVPRRPLGILSQNLMGETGPQISNKSGVVQPFVFTFFNGRPKKKRPMFLGTGRRYEIHMSGSINLVLSERGPVPHLRITDGCFGTTVAELSSHKRVSCPQS